MRVVNYASRLRAEVLLVIARSFVPWGERFARWLPMEILTEQRFAKESAKTAAEAQTLFCRQVSDRLHMHRFVFTYL